MQLGQKSATSPGKSLPLWMVIHLCHCALLLLLWLLFQATASACDWLVVQLAESGRLPIENGRSMIHFLGVWIPIYNYAAGLLILFGWIPLDRGKEASPFRLLRQNRFALAVLAFLRTRRATRSLPLLRAHRNRGALVLVKWYFLPIAIGSTIGTLQNWGSFFEMVGAWRDILDQGGTWEGLSAEMAKRGMMHPTQQLFHYPITYGVLLIDGLFASLGYLSEHPKAGGRIRAVDRRPSSWLVCLPCYPPLLIFTTLLLSQSRTSDDLLFGGNAAFVMSCQLTGLLFFLLYGISVVAMGGRYSNLTFRSVVSTGPFRFIRHPLYTFKILGWFFEWLPLLGSGANLVAFTGWALLYAMRIQTEERFLGQYPEYREYREKVRWKCIPGVW